MPAVAYIYVLCDILIMPNNLADLIFTDEQKKTLLANIQFVRQLSQQKITDQLENWIINNFESVIGYFPHIGYSTTFSEPFERIVINKYVNEGKNNARLTNYSQIKYPPLSKEKQLNYNRASMKGQSVFYAGFGMLATTLETQPELGDVITTSKWRQKGNTSLFHFPIFYKKDSCIRAEYESDWEYFNEILKSLHPSVSGVTEELLHFMAELFTKNIDKSDKREYLFSALFSRYYLTNSKSNVQCLYYPSVPSDFVSSNLACLPATLDKYFDCIEVKEDVIIKAPDIFSKGWLSRQIAKANPVSPMAEGSICWENVIDEAELTDLRIRFNIG